MRATYPLKKHRCVEQYRLADEARRYAKPFQAAVAEPFLKRRSEAILVETKAVELCSISLVYTNCTGGMRKPE